MSIQEEYRASYEGAIGADRMALGLSSIPDKLRGDMEQVEKLQEAIRRMKKAIDHYEMAIQCQCLCSTGGDTCPLCSHVITARSLNPHNTVPV